MRRLIVWSLAFLVLLFSGAVSVAAETPGVMANGKSVTFDVEPAVIDNVLMVPIRSVAEALGGKVSWDNSARSARIETGSTTVQLIVGKRVALVNGKEVSLAAPVVIRGDRTLVPASFLITFFQGHLTIAHPGLKDPTAMALLEMNAKSPVANQDVDLVQTISVAASGPVTQSLTMTNEIRAQGRGEEALVSITMKSPQIPGGAFSGLSVVRGGKSFTKAADSAWQPVPVDQAAAQAAEAFSGLQGLVSLLKEAHLGASRTEGGKTLQDVVITFDTAAVEQMLDPILKSALPPDPNFKMAMVWETLTATAAIDTVTGFAPSMTMDAAVTMTVTAEGETMTMHMTIHQTETMKPNDAPINWPADLPQA